MLKERNLTCIEVGTLAEAERYCKENKTRPDVIVISGAYFIGHARDSDVYYNFYFRSHHLTFAVNSGMYLVEDINFKVHSYNFDKHSKIDWNDLQ